MERERVKCAVCGIFFDPATSAGRWECRTHVAREHVLDRDTFVYPCCGLGRLDERAAYSVYHTHLSRHDLRGCVAADHVVVGKAVDEMMPMRPVEDLHLLSHITNSNAFDHVPDDAIVHGPLRVTYADVAKPTSTVMAFDFDAPVVTEELTVVGTKKVTRDLREETQLVIERAYAQEQLFNSKDEYQKRRDQLLRDRFAHPLDEVNKRFHEATKHLSNTDFLVQWFTKREPARIGIDICVVRAVAPTQDPTFVPSLQRQRTYVETHPNMRQ